MNEKAYNRTKPRISEEVREIRNKFIEEIYNQSTPEVIKDTESIHELLDYIDELRELSGINLGSVTNTDIIVESIAENFKKSFLNNISQIDNPNEKKKLDDINYFTNLLNKESSDSGRILNLNLRKGIENEIRGVNPQIFFMNYLVPIQDKSYDVSIYSNMTYVYKDTVTVELIYCGKMDEQKKAQMFKTMSLLQRFRKYTPERVKEFYKIANSLDAEIRFRGKH